MRKVISMLVAFSCTLILCASASAAWWPWKDHYRTPEDAENYHYDLCKKRMEWMKEYRRQEAEQAAKVAAAATPETPPAPQIDPTRLVVPQLRPLLEDAALRPQALVPRERLARSYAQLHRYDLARQTLDEGLVLQPDWRSGRLLRAQILWQEGKLDEARREYDLLVVDEPERNTPRFYRAHLLETMMRTEKAVEDWEMIAQLAQQRGLVEMNAAADKHIEALRSQ